MTALAELKDWLLMINTGVAIAAVVMMNWLRQVFVSKGDFKEVCLKVESLEDRTSKVEGEIEHLPDKDQAHRMELSLRDMRGDLNVMAERMKAVAATGERLQEFLVSEAKRAA